MLLDDLLIVLAWLFALVHFRSIEKLGDFSTIGLKNVLTNRYAVRQLIAQEVKR